MKKKMVFESHKEYKKNDVNISFILFEGDKTGDNKFHSTTVSKEDIKRQVSKDVNVQHCIHFISLFFFLFKKVKFTFAFTNSTR